MFTYELIIEEDVQLISITGVKDKDNLFGIVIVPEKIDELPVVSIGDHAFYQCKNIQKVILPNTIKYIENYAFAECRQLIDVHMSSALTKIGDYAFYNCHQLAEFDIPLSLDQMGYGAFKNCSELKLLRLVTDGKRPLAIGALIDDTSHEIGIELYHPEGVLLTKLVLTEFDYDCILQVEARQFDWVYHGSGNVYRQCISSKGIDFQKYDELFPSAVREDWPETAIRIALGRILYPYKLEEKYRVVYLDFIRQQKQKIFEQFLKNQDLYEFEKILPDLQDEASLSFWIQTAGEQNNFEFVSLLMDYRRKQYGSRKKSYDL